MRELKELQVARQALIRDQTRPCEPHKTQKVAFAVKQGRARLALIKRKLGDVDAEIQIRIAADKPQARAFEIISSIPGPGAVSAAAILIPALRLRCGRSGLTAFHRKAIRAALTPKQARSTANRRQASPALRP